MKPQAKTQTPVRTCTCKVVIGREGGGKRSEGRRDVACIYKGVKLSSAFLIQKKPCWFLGGRVFGRFK